MKVFISWSGERSRQVAELLKTWIRGVIQATDPFISTEDVAKGSLWFTEIGDTLAATNCGIICLTGDNQSNPWILFEAGALSKGLSKSRVWTFLIDIDHTTLKPPLSQFNGTKPIKDDLLKLVTSINKSLNEKALPLEVLNEAFENWWPKFEERFKAIVATNPIKAPKKRDAEDLASETLAIVRSIQETLQTETKRRLFSSMVTRSGSRMVKLPDGRIVRLRPESSEGVATVKTSPPETLSIDLDEDEPPLMDEESGKTK